MHAGLIRSGALLFVLSLTLVYQAAAQPLIYVTTGPTATDPNSYLRVMNSATKSIVSSLVLGPVAVPGASPAVVVSTDGRTAYVTFGPDVLFVNTSSVTVSGSATLGGDLGALALGADGSRLYVTHRGGNALSVVDTATRLPVGAPIPLAGTPTGVVAAPDQSRAYVLRADADAVYVVDLASRAVTGTIATHPSPVHIALHPDGSRLYVAHSTGSNASPAGDSLTVYDTASLTEISTLVLPDFRHQIGFFLNPSQVGPMAMLPSGATIYLPRISSAWRTSPTAFAHHETVEVIDTATMTIVSRVTPVATVPTGTFGFGAAVLADGSRVFMASGAGASSIDTATLAVAAAGPAIDVITSVAAAEAPDCWFEAAPRQSWVRGSGGIVTITVPARAGCAWSVTPSDSTWLVPSAAAGTGPGTVTFDIGPSAEPRTGTVRIGTQTLGIDQLIAHTVIDTPHNGSELALPFDFSGWAIDRDARPGALGTGVDYIDLWDQTGTGSGPEFVRRIFPFGERPDIAAVFGERYRRSGFNTRIGRLPAGARMLVAYAHSTHDSTFNATAVTVTVRRAPMLVIDTPGNGAAVSQPFRITGWAADMTVPDGTGVDLVHVHAYPAAGGAPIFVGAATYGTSRPDVGLYFGEQPFSGGFETDISTLPPGRYTLVVSGRTTATGTFEVSASVAVIVDNPPPPGAPFGVLDTPIADAVVAGAINITGWALDDSGVSRVTVFRDGVAGESGLVLIGDATFVEGVRPDVAAAFPNYPARTRAGWGLMVLTNMLPNGGNGSFMFHVEAYDNQGNVTLLGRRRVTANNATSDLPFGTLDTPGQGGVVSGVVPVFGWALTPGPAIIPLDGSTIDVIVDGVVVGHPDFNQCRGTSGNRPPPGTCNDDIATIFGSAYRNIVEGSGAIGSFLLDTTTLTNGIHTIEWRVTDSAGRTQGIGSRYMYVNNP